MSGDTQAQMDRLNRDVADLTVVEDATIALIENLALQIRANMNDPVALDALATALEAQKDRLAAAVAANTPAAPVSADPVPVEDPAPATDAPAPDADPTA